MRRQRSRIFSNEDKGDNSYPTDNVKSFVLFISPLLLFVPLLNLVTRIRRPEYYRYIHLYKECWEAIDKENFETAKALAMELLDAGEKQKNERKRDWNYGNAIDTGNQVLGLVCLHYRDIAGAKEHLLQAGQTPGSPQLDSYGPRMRLARALLEVGERGIVLLYLERIARFYGVDSHFPGVAEEKQRQLARWAKTIRRGAIPKDINWNVRWSGRSKRPR